MKRVEIKGGGWRWMKRMDEEDGDEWVRVKVRVGVRF